MVGQVQVFWYAVLLGLFSGFIYDVFRIIRLAFNSKRWSIFFQDILYFVIMALITFFFTIIFNNGEIRYYILAGQFIGWIAYYISVGRVVYKYSKSVLRFIKRVLGTLCYPLKSIFHKLLKLKLCKRDIKKSETQVS